jgi:hypothetical protein
MEQKTVTKIPLPSQWTLYRQPQRKKAQRKQQ